MDVVVLVEIRERRVGGYRGRALGGTIVLFVYPKRLVNVSTCFYTWAFSSYMHSHK